MAESGKTFKVYHYQQVKCETKTEVESSEKGKGFQNNVEQIWLADDDPRRYQSDEEIMYEKIDLSNSALSRKEKAKLMKMLIKYRDAFSLRDEIGECPNLRLILK